MGVGEATQEPKKLQAAVSELALISGQKPAVCRARKSVANFKLREGMAIGCKVTLRQRRMYEFLDRLVNVALPRVRDFRGLPTKSFDGRGNYALGLKEQIIFPEINYDDVDEIRGHGRRDLHHGAERRGGARSARAVRRALRQLNEDRSPWPRKALSRRTRTGGGWSGNTPPSGPS